MRRKTMYGLSPGDLGDWVWGAFPFGSPLGLTLKAIELTRWLSLRKCRVVVQGTASNTTAFDILETSQ